MIKRLFPVEAQLGEQQLLDNFGRTSLTIAVLFVVSATSVSIGITSLMITGDVQSWLDRTLTSDFLLRASRILSKTSLLQFVALNRLIE